MERDALEKLLNAQQTYFDSGATLPISWRLEALDRLKTAVLQGQDALCRALERDLGKSRYESYLTEIGQILEEITFLRRHVRRFAAPRRVKPSLAQLPARCRSLPVPYGPVLIMSPWNYPALLSLVPLADALAAGNTAIVKPSAYAPNVSKTLEALLHNAFPREQVAVILGGREENQALLDCNFSYIFFTGSQRVGREVLKASARRLIPVTLELGGKSPCLVDETADLALAARRIVFGKFLNCGQTCVAPDYVCCHRSVEKELTERMKREIVRQYSASPLENPQYGRIVNEKQFDRLSRLLDETQVLFGGQRRRESLQIAPALLRPEGWDAAVMEEEIFGPLLPIVPYDDLEEAEREIRRRPKPLALYVFTRDRNRAKVIMGQWSFGGGCVNDTVLHLATSQMGFGGVGESGMGAYHGKTGFDTFSHNKSIVDKFPWPDVPLRYAPYREDRLGLLKKILK